MEVAERVGESGVEQLGHLSAFLIGESGVAAVGFRVFKVDFAMRHVQVAAHHHGLLAVEPFQISPEIVFPRHPVVQTAQTILRVWHVDRHKVKRVVFKRYHSALGVVVGNADAVCRRQRFVAGIDGSAGVAFLLGIVPVGAVAVKLQVELTSLHLCFLQTEKIGVESVERLLKAFANAGAKPVDVPRYKFHKCSPVITFYANLHNIFGIKKFTVAAKWNKFSNFATIINELL